MAFIPYTLQLRSGKGKSTAKKTFIIVVAGLMLLINYLVLYQNILTFIDVEPPLLNPGRKLVYMLMGTVIFLYLFYYLFNCVSKKLDGEETASIVSMLGVLYLIYTYLIYDTSSPISYYAYAAIAIFCIGILISFVAYKQRADFYADRDHAGLLYTGGLYKYSRYIFYFGDFLWVLGYTMVLHRKIVMFIPFGLFAIYAFYNAPKLDKINTKKYGKDFYKLKNNSRKVIPYLF
jgi:protein-S-isoprenylcysteine O-methyltransferase Ste14